MDPGAQNTSPDSNILLFLLMAVFTRIDGVVLPLVHLWYLSVDFSNSQGSSRMPSRGTDSLIVVTNPPIFPTVVNSSSVLAVE
jgi:hypothetical protein